MNKLFLSFIFVSTLVLLTLNAFGQSDFTEFRILHVKYRGYRHISKKELAKSMVIRPTPRWRFWQSKTPYTVDDLDEDRLRIQRLYESHGYYHTKVRFEIEHVKGQDLISIEGNLSGVDFEEQNRLLSLPRVKVIFFIEEGAPAIVHSVTLNIRGDLVGTNKNHLENSLTMKQGDIFSLNLYRQTKKEILTIMGDTGYPFAQISGKAVVDTSADQVNIIFDVFPAKKCKFAQLHISDTVDFIEESVIRRAVEFQPGDTYSVSQVNETVQNLYSLDLFKAVTIRPEETADIQTIVPLSVDAEQKKKQNLRIGVGIGEEDGARVRASWVYRNILGWAGKLSLSAKRSDLIRNVEANYRQPYFLNRKNTVGITVGYEREFLESHDSRELFGNLTFSRNFIRYWVWEGSYKLELSEVEELNISDPEELEKFNRDNNFLISSAKIGVARNTVNNDLDPTKGSVMALSIESASTALGSEVDFVSPNFELKKHITIRGKLVLSGHLNVETILETEDTKDIPIVRRLFLGGGESVRGYGFQKLGPLDANGDPIGGLSSFLTNLELRYPVYKKIHGALFLDMGTVDEQSFSFDFDDLRFSCGIGFRYATPIGPIRLDWGYKLNPPKKGDFGNVDESDEEIEARWKVHISVGQAF